MSFADLFGIEGHLTWGQECARAVLVFGFGLLLVRVSGRRVFAKWSALDIIVGIIVGSNLSRVITGSATIGGTLAGTALLMALHWLLAHAAARWPRFARIVEGAPVFLARQGATDGPALLRQSISEYDLDEALRQSSVEHVGETRLVVLEPSGKITVLKAMKALDHGSEWNSVG